MKGIVALTVLLSVLLGAPLQTRALDLVPLTVDQLIDRSPRIVIATCAATETRPVQAYGGNPFTFSRFDKVETLAGNLSGSFEVRLFGGRLGNTRIWEDGLPTFTPGTRYLLFLGPSNKDGFPLLKPQGVFEVLHAQGEPPAERLRATLGQGNPDQTLAQIRARIRERRPSPATAAPTKADPSAEANAPASHRLREANTPSREPTSAAVRQLHAP
ncbi:MAG: hypothetical protein C0434_02415 [Xanthomonadaceae bacterium]|nr:hypothetical protein [Xanthomonadaceae bacterium]